MKTVATARWGLVRVAEGSNEQQIADAAKKKSDAEVPSQVCSQGEEQKIADEARKKADAMTPQPKITPSKAAAVLRTMASKIEASQNPDPKRLMADVAHVVTEIWGDEISLLVK